METKVERFKEIANDLAELYEKKNADYGDSFGETYQKLGVISAITRMTDKLNRFTNLNLKGNQKVNNETLKDTILDLAAYAIMTAIEIERK